MAGFIYYIPGRNRQVNAQDLAGLGLAHIATHLGGPESRQITNAGPDGGGGYLVVPQHPSSPDCLYTKAEQTWRKAGTFWVGWLTARPPAAAELAREVMLGGAAVKLRDGGEWIVPRVHAVIPSRPSNLPRVFDVAEAGDWTSRIAPEYEGICERAHRFFQSWASLVEQAFLESELIDLCIDVLALNYRISKAEVAALGLLGSAELRLASRAIIDADEIEARVLADEKKNVE